MGDVIPLRRAARAEPDSDRQAIAGERANSLRAVLDGSPPPKMSREDQVSVAEALWLILDRAKTRSGISTATVMRDAGIGGEGDSTKHLGQYAVCPTWPQQRKSKARLTKKPASYRRLAEAAARLAGWDQDDILIELFGKTSLFGDAPSLHSAPEYEELARTLCAVANAVAVKHKLQEYFQSVARRRPSLGIPSDLKVDRLPQHTPDDLNYIREYLQENIEFSLIDSLLEWPKAFRSPSSDVDHHDDYGSIPPYPAVVLGEWDVGKEVTMEIERCESANDEGFETWSPLGRIQGMFRAELRLCIIPVGQDMRPEAAVRILMSIRIKPLEVTTRGGTNEGDAAIAEIIEFEGVFRRVVLSSSGMVTMGVFDTNGSAAYRVSFAARLLPELLQRRHFQLNQGRCQFHPVTAPLCEFWFRFQADDNIWHPRDELHLIPLGPAIVDWWIQYGVSNLPHGTIAATIDLMLSRQSGPDLVGMLDERAARLVALLAAHETAEQARRNAGYTDLEARLKAMRGSET